MSVLEARGIGVAFAAGLPVFEGASFVLEPGFYGLLGANGAGKTTLLRVLSGALAPSEGTVHVRPRDATLVVCEQEIHEPHSDIALLAESMDGVAAEMRGRLDLDPAALDRWPTLSPGERKRWQIGAALVREPDILFLDEPTNHLDAAARRRLLGALRRFTGIGLIVSHDREVLEELPRAILRVHGGAVTLYDGAYSAARAQWEDARADRESAHARARGEARALERRLDAARRIAAATSRSISARSRMKGPQDHRADRVRIAGPNGAGKTTLLEALVRSRADRVLYLPQELDPDAVAADLARLEECTPEERGRVLSVFAALGSDPERVLGRSRGLSPGEARKLALSLALGLHAWALVLDEPTNHLDLPTIERLESALVAFPGCVVLVTHDDAFAAAVTTRTVEVSSFHQLRRAFRHGGDVGV